MFSKASEIPLTDFFNHNHLFFVLFVFFSLLMTIRLGIWSLRWSTEISLVCYFLRCDKPLTGLTSHFGH